MKRALVTGITGQDGSYLAELLLGKGYEVHGIIRRSSSFNTGRIDHLRQGDGHGEGSLKLEYGDVTDPASLRLALDACQPDEIYNLAAQSHVRLSFDQPAYTVDTIAAGTLNLLEAYRAVCPKARFYQASSSEMFGNTPSPQDERTPFDPQSPYACAKIFAHQLAGMYRAAYGLHICCGIAFNHESPRRGETFVPRKITRAVTRIAEGLQEKLYLGNLDAKRDWGFAGDYVKAMWLMLQQDQPDDYVIATGKSHSVREWLEMCLKRAEIDHDGHVVIDPRYFRPTEVYNLCGDSSKARTVLGWRPTVDFGQLAAMMFAADWRLARDEKLIAGSVRGGRT